MKLSISFPDQMAREVQILSRESERPISWWLQKAWEVARSRLLYGDRAQTARTRALKKLASLRGILKEDYPDTDSVTLSHQAFLQKK